jgi:WD40 repeat protein
MRLSELPARGLTNWVANLRESARKALHAPLRWPKMTTRRLMALVALVALGFWAVRQAPRMMDYERWAFSHARAATQSREAERARLLRVRARQAQLDQLRRDTGGREKPTEELLARRLRRELVEAAYFQDEAEYRAKLARKYRLAMWFPWIKVAPDRQPPRYPSAQPVPKPGESKAYAVNMAGGRQLTFSPDGKTIAVSCWDHTVKLLDPVSGEVRGILKVPINYEHGGVFSPDGAIFAAAGDSNRVWLWDVSTGSLSRELAWLDASAGGTIKFHSIDSLVFSRDGETIAVTASGELVMPAATNAGPMTVRSASSLGRPKLWSALRVLDARTGELRWQYTPLADWIGSPTFSSNGDLVAFGGSAALVLDAHTGRLKKTLKPATGTLASVAVSPDGRTIAGAGPAPNPPVTSIAAYEASRVTLWDAATGSIRQTLQGPPGHGIKVAFSPDGKTVAEGGTAPRPSWWYALSEPRGSPATTSEVTLWNTATGKRMWSTQGEAGPITSMAFSPDGSMLGFSDMDFVYLLDAHTGRLKRILMETTRTLRPMGLRGQMIGAGSLRSVEE